METTAIDLIVTVLSKFICWALTSSVIIPEGRAF